MGKKIPLWQALLVMAYTLVALVFTILKCTNTDLHIPLITAAVVASGVAVANGWKWNYIEKGIINSISRSMQACLILMTVGMLIGAWIAGGIVPAMIFYGLKILSPGIFLVACCVISGIVALATGSSWTTAGTIGIALIGVGMGLDMNPAMTAGAVVSGAYFGDKMSPLSDTTNLAPAVAGSNLFDHIKHMVYTVTPSLLIAIVIYAVLGMGAAGKDVDMSGVSELTNTIQASFHINPLLLIPPLLVIAMVALKIPAIPGLIGGAALGIACAAAFQGLNILDWSQILHYGYVADTGNVAVDELLTRGGLESMLWTVSLIICAMTFGGVMDSTGMLATMAESLLKFAKNTGLLVTVTVFSCVFVNIIASDQYLSIILPGRMYKEAFEDRRLKGKNLSRCLEDSGTITSALVPWNTCGATMSTYLGVETVQYGPYAFLNWINPLVSIFYGFTGITMEKMTDAEYDALLKQRALDAELAAKSMEE